MKKQLRSIAHHALTDHSASQLAFVTLTIYVAVFAYYNFYHILRIPFNLEVLSILIPIFFTDVLKTASESLFHKRGIYAGEDIRKVTVVIPTYNGEKTLGITIQSLLKRLPAQHIIVSSNGSTDGSCALAEKLGVRVFDHREPIGKVRAINEALSAVTTPYCLILDDDTLLGDAIVPTNLLDAGYEGVAFRVLPIKEGWLSVMQTHEYRKSMDIGRGFHNATASVQSISGAIGLFHTKELLRQIRLHSGEFSGEDLQRTLLILTSSRRKGVVMADSTVYTYVPATLPDLLKQRILGWNPGFFANIGMFWRILWQKQTPQRLRFEAFYSIFVVIAMDPLRIVTLPVLLFSPTYLLIFYVTYVLLEYIPYQAMGRQEPFWVVLLAPLYGLVNSVARFLSLATFLFRRLSYYVGRATHYDDYRHVPVHVKFVSQVGTVLLFALAFACYSVVLLLPAILPW